jgi:uncharacterized protein
VNLSRTDCVKDFEEQPMRTRRAILRCAGSYVAFCVILAILLGEVAFHPAQRPNERKVAAQRIEAQHGTALEDVSLTSADGIRLCGWFARPAKSNGDGVILLHGVGDNRQGMLGFAELFLSKGYVVLMPDLRGHGESGGFPTYGIKEVGDVKQWVDWLARRTNPACIFGMGESMGAAIILQATRSVPFCAVVAESPFASFRQIAYLRVGQFIGVGDWAGRIALRPAVELAFLYGWLTRGINLSSISPEMSVAESRVPILLIHGLADTSIPYQQSEMIAAINPVAITLWKVPNADHTQASNAAGREFEVRVLDWFASHRSCSGER